MEELMVKELLEEINWCKIHDYMVDVNWRWEGERIPSVGELYQLGEQLLDEVSAAGESSVSSTGGFHAVSIFQDNQLIFLHLSFAVNSAYIFRTDMPRKV